ncbi:MAG: NAD-binding protein [Candidatus Omnitrophica bacterium]|nr:NAD-binding protein [Candidatus Omnitrophota bacterium]MBU0878499.1 NAD-binding protein [Candidatus Omnitrophota bacterium]MBU1134545.1 NAD-binding protein [Candidatus Omnitrophota bacterium]MBU1366805.1 NAD-binding protein [Candidatus Omnitrophota bacterium]MBU1524363.1 NAD-binding protein [Candidatus Omnitrophota bacterium]
MKHIIIVGCGKIGKGLALELSSKENVTIIDKSLKVLDSLGDDFNGKKIWGDVLDMDVLEEAGVEKADTTFLLTGNDNLNLVVGKATKRKYGTKKVILQVNDVAKKKAFQEEGLTIVNRTYLIVEVLKKCI